ncbi:MULTISPECIES: AglZ/HisF2 family acetamidino modification protein [Vibrio]|uniref:AglZ/HisF2 family acetamidino modification protein n=1 Tax=Vibrio TaxID=662 RepID=UPI0021C4C552|nr:MULTISPECIES: AglZ/HisF2 family acetamidino modification protein [Vibrio]MDE1319345.1 AglZ/HisF2 family acetamidino modification protein [Vibrio aestuarianus]MDF9399671.1 imidazole glycerol phosphate synthase cyclase subunit [Vibrio sp. 1180_3]CAH8241981.1 Putative imidazole glycerol phosphate synthase subunit HisF [Vibrio aestuarianus]
MLRPRVIPCLLIHQGGLVKTQKFGSPKYVGDPINAVKIFNEKESDELMVIDIDATVNGAEPDYDLIAKLAAECRMPLCYGGGIKTAAQASRIIDLGVEKVALSSAAIADPNLIGEISSSIGSQSVVVVVDVQKKKGLFSNSYQVLTHNATQAHKIDLFALAKTVEEHGAGELVINSVDLDGMMTGYDLELSKKIKEQMHIPVTFLGGAGNMSDLEKLVQECGVVGVAAGSLFVFKGKYRAVLISYPTKQEKTDLSKQVSI